MGKAGYKRFKKQEKAKVKLKGNKTLLPKGQNVTDTAFKVKKIIVKEQLKQHGEQELLTKKHLNIKELISRLTHHNVSMRQEALSGIKELISNYGRDIVLANFSTLLQTMMSLTIDKESDVRSDMLKLLSSIFDKVTEKELSPFFPVIICYLTCAMTHIEPGVRADSLRLLDTMLTTQPTLIFGHISILLPHFLDLISQRPEDAGNKTRKLSLNLDGRVTSEKWRCRVIGQLKRLFSVIWDNHKKVLDQAGCTVVRWAPDKKIYLGLFPPLLAGTKNADGIKNFPIKEYAEVLIPLLLDTFIEAVPKQEEESNDVCVIGVDTAALIQSIVEVILHIWNLLEITSQSENLRDWFKKTWGDLVVSRILQGRFPYSIITANSRKRQRDSNQILAVLQMSKDPSCSILNLQLCLLAFLLTSPGPLWIQSIQYIKRSLRSGRLLQAEDSTVLCQCLEAASTQPLPNSISLLHVIAKCNILNSVDEPVNKRAFDFLTTIALMPAHHLHQDKNFTTWLDSLPAFLSKAYVPLSVIKSIAKIATRNLPAFTNSLDGWIEAILDNLPRLRVIGGNVQEGRKLIVGLVYWVTDWDRALVESMGQLIQKCTLGSETISYMVDLLKLKIKHIEDEEIISHLKQMLHAVEKQKIALENPDLSCTLIDIA